MQNQVLVSVVYGRDLSAEELDAINRYKSLEFNANIIIAPKPGDDDWDKPYFLARLRGELVAFGRLHTVKIEFESKPYTILGIATVIAIQKGQGYGSKLVERMKAYIHDSGSTAIGFCDPAVSAFYQKCGYSILAHGVSRFRFFDQNSRVVDSPYPDDDVVYLEGEDGLAEKLRENQDKHIMAFRAAW